MTPVERFAANLRQVRTGLGVSQEKLAELCDLHRTEISLLERAGREPRLATIVKLAGALEVMPSELLGGMDWLPQKQRFRVVRPPRPSS